MKKFYYLPFMALAMFFSVVSTAQSIYLEIKEVEGEVTRKGFEKQIEAFAYSQSSTGCPIEFGGQQGCKIVSSGFQFQLSFTSALKDLKKLLYEGKQIAEVKVSFVKEGPDAVIYHQIILNTVQISVLSESISAAENNVFLEFSPTKAEWIYFKQLPTGGVRPAGSFAWDFSRLSSF